MTAYCSVGADKLEQLHHGSDIGAWGLTEVTASRGARAQGTIDPPTEGHTGGFQVPLRESSQLETARNR